jgi:hypothetical protein
MHARRRGSSPRRRPWHPRAGATLPPRGPGGSRAARRDTTDAAALHDPRGMATTLAWKVHKRAGSRWLAARISRRAVRGKAITARPTHARGLRGCRKTRGGAGPPARPPNRSAREAWGPRAERHRPGAEGGTRAREAHAQSSVNDPVELGLSSRLTVPSCLRQRACPSLQPVSRWRIESVPLDLVALVLVLIETLGPSRAHDDRIEKRVQFCGRRWPALSFLQALTIGCKFQGARALPLVSSIGQSAQSST